MANVKISALPVASNVASADTFPFVQGAVTKQVTRDVLMELVSAGAGTASLPSYTFAGDADTGMWSPAANTLAWSVNGIECMRLDASGNLGIGTSSPAEKLAVNQGNFYAIRTGGAKLRLADQNNEVSVESSPVGIASNMIFKTSALTQMTLDASGNLLVGQTSSGVKNSNSFGLDVSGGGYLTISHINGSASGTRYEYYGYNGLEIGSVTQNGTTAVLYNVTSDRRLKDNIAPAPSASDVIDAIEIVSHDWKSAPDEHVTYGVIAQDLALVAPQAVLQGDDGEEVEKTWGVDYSKLVPMLIKEIQSLRARVAALELR